MHRKIVVTIGYYDFQFNDIDEAMRFADTAILSNIELCLAIVGDVQMFIG